MMQHIFYSQLSKQEGIANAHHVRLFIHIPDSHGDTYPFEYLSIQIF